MLTKNEYWQPCNKSGSEFNANAKPILLDGELYVWIARVFSQIETERENVFKL